LLNGRQLLTIENISQKGGCNIALSASFFDNGYKFIYKLGREMKGV